MTSHPNSFLTIPITFQKCGIWYSTEQSSGLRKTLLFTWGLFFPSWPFPHPSGSTGHQHISPCQVQCHPSSTLGFWVASENSSTRVANTWHNYISNTGTWSPDASSGAAAAWWMSTWCYTNISCQEAVFLALFSIFKFHQMSFNNWGSEMDRGLQETIMFWQGMSLIRNNECLPLLFSIE